MESYNRATEQHDLEVAGLKDIAQAIIQSGDVNERNEQGKTALHLAAYLNQTEVIQGLLQQVGLDLNPQDNDGDTPLHYACARGYLEVVKQLVEAGADINMQNNVGDTPLHKAANHGF